MVRVLCSAVITAMGVWESHAATASVAIPASTIAAWTGDNADSDPLGLAFNGGALFFFEGRSVGNGDPMNVTRALLHATWPGAALGIQLRESEMRALTAQPGAIFTVLDLCALPGGGVAAILSDTLTGSEFLVRTTIPSTGALLVQGTGAEGAVAIAADASAQRLYVLATAAQGAASPGLLFLDLSGSIPATALTMHAAQASLAAALTTGGTAQWLPSDLTVQGDGDVIIFNAGPNIGSGGDLGSDGDAVRVTPAGAVSLFFDRSLLDGVTGDPGTTGYDGAVIAGGSDHILVAAFETDGGGATTAQEFLARVSPDGTSAMLVKTEAQIVADLGGGATDLSFTRRGVVLDGGGNLLWSANGGGIPQGILQLSGPVPAELSAFGAD